MCLAIPGKLVAISPDEQGNPVGEIHYGDVVQLTSLAFVPEARVNDYLLVHAGFAITVIDEESALASIREYAELQALNNNAGESGE